MFVFKISICVWCYLLVSVNCFVHTDPLVIWDESIDGDLNSQNQDFGIFPPDDFVINGSIGPLNDDFTDYASFVVSENNAYAVSFRLLERERLRFVYFYGTDLSSLMNSMNLNESNYDTDFVVFVPGAYKVRWEASTYSEYSLLLDNIPITWEESMLGDLAGSFIEPTFLGILKNKHNLVVGDVGGQNIDLIDAFSFVVPPGSYGELTLVKYSDFNEDATTALSLYEGLSGSEGDILSFFNVGTNDFGRVFYRFYPGEYSLVINESTAGIYYGLNITQGSFLFRSGFE